MFACLGPAASTAAAEPPTRAESPFLPAPTSQLRASAEPASPQPADAAERTYVSDERGTTYWSRVLYATSIRSRPSSRSSRRAKLRPYTWYGLDEAVIVLEQRGRWSKIRYAGIGRRTGWVPAAALTRPRLTTIWVVVDRRRRQLRVYRGKRRALTAAVGVGAVGSPTPGGRFLIRERLVPRNKRGIYGILAFGLSAYSRHRTDWPGGGQVGIHGTNQPGLIPGRISNGCIRLRNRDVRKFGRLVHPGVPVRVR